MKTNNGVFGKAFFIIIPIGIFLICVVINWFMDIYYQKKLDDATVEVLNYIITKDLPTSDDYKALALEQYEEKGYDTNPETLSIISNEEYVLIIKYDYIHDLKAFLNIFNVKWFDKDGYVSSDKTINDTMDKNTGMIVSKYIAKLNEYNEPVIEKFTGDEDELFKKELEKLEQQQTTTVVVQNE